MTHLLKSAPRGEHGFELWCSEEEAILVAQAVAIACLQGVWLESRLTGKLWFVNRGGAQDAETMKGGREG